MEVDENILENVRFNSDLRLSFNQIKGILNAYIGHLAKIKVITNDDQEKELPCEVIIDMILFHLNRKEVVELLDMLQIIRNRKSSIQYYLQYVFQGILDTKKI